MNIEAYNLDSLRKLVRSLQNESLAVGIVVAVCVAGGISSPVQDNSAFFIEPNDKMAALI